MKILTGAENLYRATGNCKVKETVALELNFVEASVDLLKEELIELNGTLKVSLFYSQCFIYQALTQIWCRTPM